VARSLSDRRAIGAALIALVAGAAAPAWSASGAFERTWGFDVDASNPGTGFEVCTVAANCKAGVPSGPVGGGLNAPIAIGTGRAGEVYVGDAATDRIQKFEADGTFVAAWGEGVVSGTPGTYEICTVPESLPPELVRGHRRRVQHPVRHRDRLAGQRLLGGRRQGHEARLRRTFHRRLGEGRR
jgi:hypothetical protein